jgi:Kef-type K+ transport system membrane component KefB
MTLLLCVLALSYVGSMLMQGRALRGFGLPSGSEWLLLGIVVGPHVLGSVDPGLLRAFEPLAAMGVGWLAFVTGAGFVRGVRQAGARAVLLGCALALGCVGAVGLCVYAVAQRALPLRGVELWIVAAGAGLVSCETTRYAALWLVARHHAHGPLVERIAGLAAGDDAVPLLLLAVPFSLLAPSATYSIPWWGWSIATLALGVLLGMTSAMLLRFSAGASHAIGVLLGAALLASGIAWRLGLSAPTVMFALGLTIALGSRHRDDVADLLGRTEHPVLLPVLLLAGASVRFELDLGLGLVVASACAARMLVRALAGPLVGGVTEGRARPGPALGLGLLSTGTLTSIAGLAFALRFPGVVGNVVLCTAIAQTLIGELLGPACLRSALIRTGEIAPQSRVVKAGPAA